MTRSPDEIARALGELHRNGVPLRAQLSATLAFTTLLRFVDPERRFIVVNASAEEEALQALLARASVTFFCMVDGRHTEFAAATPQMRELQGQNFVRLDFPHVLATIQRRLAERRPTAGKAVPVLADANGFMAFDAQIVDVSPMGLGLIHYAADIQLEPGTLLKGCRVELPGRAPLAVDMEVRYSYPVNSPEGVRAQRSGCRFVNPPEELKSLLAQLFAQSRSE